MREILFSNASSDKTLSTIISFFANIDLLSELQGVDPNGKMKLTLLATSFPCRGGTDTRLNVDSVDVFAVSLPNALLLFPRRIVGRYTQRTRHG